MKRNSKCVFIVFNGGLGIESQHKTLATAKKAAKKLASKDNPSVKKYCKNTSKLSIIFSCHQGKCQKYGKKYKRRHNIK